MAIELESRIAALENQVKALSDCEAIRQVLARYGPLADSADTPERRKCAGSLFAETGIYDLGEDWGASGPEDIGELLNNPQHLELVANGSAHVMGMPTIEVAGDRASAFSYSRVYRHVDGNFEVWRVSANWWQLERSDAEWKVTRRINRLLDGSDAARALLRRVNGARDQEGTHS